MYLISTPTNDNDAKLSSQKDTGKFEVYHTGKGNSPVLAYSVNCPCEILSLLSVVKTVGKQTHRYRRYC